ncbi:Cdc15p [Rhizophagus irregularis DAOM 197198w]|uniref:Cdc15p n=2 Tax=Rhizophagus irregularis TaxID=588596 RepID=A0A015MZ85_RHIIW|nr:Cdc15p [Rhizophagus irregularis DAOM 197198w]
MEILNKASREKPKNLWKYVDSDKYHKHVTISSIDSVIKSEEIDDKIIYMDEIEKRKEVYGICGECNEPGTGEYWCQPCNAKRFEENFKNWTSGNKEIDELIQHSLGVFVALKSLDNSSEISTDFLNEIKSHLQIFIWDIIYCYGITQDPNTKDYMMVSYYCENGNLRNYYLNNSDNIKLYHLLEIANGLLSIHNAEKVHKDFHSCNILEGRAMYISDLGMCQPANNKEKSDKKGVYGVLPYMAPEVLRGYQYTKAADIYSFGIIMNEFLSEEIPFNDIPHDHILAVKICKGFRPKISEHIPKFLVDLIMKCWDARAENRPIAKELYQTLKKWEEIQYNDDKISSQMSEYEDKIREKKSKNRSNGNNSESIKTHPQAIYTIDF